MNAPTFLSTFSGVGGIDLGLERAGWRCVGQAEADPYRRAVLAERFPGVPCAADVRSVGLVGRDDGRPQGGRNGDAPHRDLGGGADAAPDLLCGGFPCQDLSVAGRRRGLAGERSGLFFEFARIADALRPRWLLIENVPGLFTSNGGRDFGVLLGTLADLGYGVAWRVLDSRFFGVPQRRRRVFIVASNIGGRAGAECAGQVLAVGQGCERHLAAGGEAGTVPAAGVGDGVEGVGVVSRMPSTNHGGWRIGAEEAAGGALQVMNLRGREEGARPELDHLASVRASAGGSSRSYVAGAAVRRLTPRECERLQGFPDDWTLIEWQGKPAADSRRYAACGDAVTVPVAQWLGERLMAAHMEDMRVAA